MNQDVTMISQPDLWNIHSYYTLCPYAPDGSGRLLIAGADLDNSQGQIYILSKEGKILKQFGPIDLYPAFYHTGFWQTWGPDCKYIYYQGGSLKEPKIVRLNIATEAEKVIEGGMQGAPPSGEPIFSGLLGLLYAAGYGDGIYKPEEAPVPFQERDSHGIFKYEFDPDASELALSVSEVLAQHPDRDVLIKEDKKIKKRLGENDGLTLMLYCVRWHNDGSRFLFYFGNHCVKRKEPRLAYVFTADRNLKNIELALDISFNRYGVHWSWHPDGEHLIGYGPDPDNPGQICLAQVGYDGSDYRKIADHSSGGHPSISPADYNLLVTDTGGQPGQVIFIDLTSGKIVKKYDLPRVYGTKEPKGRNPFRVCHHPVISRDGQKVLVNTLPGRNAQLAEINVENL